VAGDDAVVVAAEDVRVAFGENVVLDGASLEVRRGETVAILGESGSGKSVFLKVVLGLLPPDRGTVRLFGQDVVGKSEEDLEPVRRRASVVYQTGALFSGLDVGENVALELREVLDLSAEEARARVAESLEGVGLADLDPKTMPDALSGGMRKRVAIARAIAPKPEAIFYDEPTSGLDPINSARILDLIRELHDRMGVTSLVVTHDVLGVCRIASRIALISDARFVFDGPPDEFLSSSDPAVAAFRDPALEAAASAMSESTPS
jgi:phospholipid/cholesterol/gamma-HCH transport system ATP-binding protein